MSSKDPLWPGRPFTHSSPLFDAEHDKKIHGINGEPWSNAHDPCGVKPKRLLSGADYMQMKLTLVLALAVFSLGAVEASAQSRFDVGLLLGSTRATDEGAALQFDRGTTYQATFAWRVWRTDAASVSIEVPFIASPAFTIVTPGASLPLEYASLYLTPGVRVTFLPSASVSF